MELPFEKAFREWAQRSGHTWEHVRYPRLEAGGETCAVRIAPPGRPRGIVLATHGAGNDSLFAMVGLFRALLAAGFEIFSFDLDGHGRSGSTTLDGAAVRGAVPEAVARSGAVERGLPLHAIGISLGGAIVLGSLPALRPRPASAVLITAPLRVELSPGAFLRELGLPLARLLWRERRDYGLGGLVPSFGPFKRGTYPLRLAAPAPSGSFGYVAALNQTLAALDLEAAAREVATPVLLVYGARDRLVPLWQGQRLARLLPRSELLALPGETHLTSPLSPIAIRRAVEWIGGGVLSFEY